MFGGKAKNPPKQQTSLTDADSHDKNKADELSRRIAESQYPSAPNAVERNVPVLTDLVNEGDRDIIEALRRNIHDELTFFDISHISDSNATVPAQNSGDFGFIEIDDASSQFDQMTLNIDDPNHTDPFDQSDPASIILEYDHTSYEHNYRKDHATKDNSTLVSSDSHADFETPDSLNLDFSNTDDKIDDSFDTETPADFSEKTVVPPNLFEYIATQINARIATRVEHIIHTQVDELFTQHIPELMKQIQGQIEPIIRAELEDLVATNNLQNPASVHSTSEADSRQTKAS